MNTAELKFLDLCDEIDYWKNKSKDLEKQLYKTQEDFSKFVSKGHEHNNIMIGHLLKATLKGGVV